MQVKGGKEAVVKYLVEHGIYLNKTDNFFIIYNIFVLNKYILNYINI